MSTEKKPKAQIEPDDAKPSKSDKTGKSDKSGLIHWLANAEAHDYPAASSYLSLTYPPPTTRKLITALRAAKVIEFKAKDIFRASNLPLLGADNFHVQKDRKKIKAGDHLSPLLLVRATDNTRVVIADGYHRLCAIYGFDEDAWIKCKIV